MNVNCKYSFVSQSRYVVEDKKVKKHVKAFYSIMNTMEDISKQLDPNLDYTEDNINDYVRPILGRDLDSMETFLVLGKLHYGKEENTI